MEQLHSLPFGKVSIDKWSQMATNQLKGADPFEKLGWAEVGVTSIKPYYDSSDLEELEYLVSFYSSLPNHRWKLYERIQVNNEKEANEKAVEALMGGCDGIIFENSSNELDTKSLLKEIDCSICDISIGFHELHLQGMNDNNTYYSKIENHAIHQLQEIINNIGQDHGWIHRLAFKDFFIEVATLRALRYLLNTDLKMYDVKIHTQIPMHESAESQWFLNTTAALASILGGTTSIDLPTATGESRISRNVGNLIREENGIEEYHDQCGGSFYIEALTHQIIQNARIKTAK